MKKISLVLLMVLLIVGSQHVVAQGLTVHLKDGTRHNYPYSSIDSVVSYGYDRFPSLTLTTDNVENLNAFSIAISGHIQGSDDSLTINLLYGTEENLSFDNGEVISTKSRDDFEFIIKGLIEGNTYYYRPYVLIEDQYYWGEKKSFVKEGEITYTMKGKTYRMVRVSGGSMADFYIMQTELLVDEPLYFGDISISPLNDGKLGVLKSEYWDFISEIREKTGLYFRLPTKDEWMFAAQGGNKSQGFTYSGSDNIDEVAWYKGNCSGPKDIALKKPNELGLYDMSGNFGEIVWMPDEKDGVDGDCCGGSWAQAEDKCTTTSWHIGDRSKKMEGTNYSEVAAFNNKYLSIRLVFSTKKETFDTVGK